MVWKSRWFFPSHLFIVYLNVSNLPPYLLIKTVNSLHHNVTMLIHWSTIYNTLTFLIFFVYFKRRLILNDMEYSKADPWWTVFCFMHKISIPVVLKWLLRKNIQLTQTVSSLCSFDLLSSLLRRDWLTWETICLVCIYQESS